MDHELVSPDRNIEELSYVVPGFTKYSILGVKQNDILNALFLLIFQSMKTLIRTKLFHAEI